MASQLQEQFENLLFINNANKKDEEKEEILLIPSSENGYHGNHESHVMKSLFIEDKKEDDNPVKWKDGIVYYTLDNSVQKDLKELILKSIDEFTIKQTPIQWIERRRKQNEKNYVKFVQLDSLQEPFSSPGCTGGEQYISIPYPKMQGGIKITMVCILHEMLHTLGFYHEQQRQDRHLYNLKAIDHSSDNELLDSNIGLCLGQFDYQSIMLYQINRLTGLESNNDELIKYAGNSTTFSEGDLAAIRRAYGGPTAHFGIWHLPCSNQDCNAEYCYCGSCGKLNNGINCGFLGHNKMGHWSCCFLEDKNNLKCRVKHTSYYHLKHEGNKCRPSKCVCNSCGLGCRYKGNKGHWSCCLMEDLKQIECDLDPYKQIPK